VKIWLDDRRPPPEPSWTWCHTVSEARALLERRSSPVTEISLDHDLGPGQPDAMTLVVWMVDHDLVPFLVNIHTWNSAGALRMETFLLQHGSEPIVSPDPRPPT